MVKAKLKTIYSFYKITGAEAEPELINENPTHLPLVEPEPVHNRMKSMEQMTSHFRVLDA
jgi:hypothetical protein